MHQPKVTTIADPPDSTSPISLWICLEAQVIFYSLSIHGSKIVNMSFWPGNCTNKIPRSRYTSRLSELKASFLLHRAIGNTKKQHLGLLGRLLIQSWTFPWGFFKHYLNSPLIATLGKGHYYMGQAHEQHFRTNINGQGKYGGGTGLGWGKREPVGKREAVDPL